MKIKLTILLSTLTILYSCQRDRVYKIKEIYYRPISAGASYNENQNGSVENKSKVLIIFENDSGVIFDDKRDIAKIDEIIQSRINEINSGVNLLSKLEVIHPIKRKRIDNNNFIITINNKTTQYNIIYKCNLTKNNELKSKLYLMDKEDTVSVCESGQGNDTAGIYFFKKWQINYGSTELKFPNYDKSIKRELSDEIPKFKKNGNSYEDEIANFIKVQKLPINAKPIIDKYVNNKIAIDLTYTGPTLAGSEVYFNIKILDKMVYQQFQTRGSTNIYYTNNRPLSKKELDLITNTLNYSEIKSNEFKLPIPEIKNHTVSLDLFIKHNNNIAIGGLLYPVKLTRSLQKNYPNKNPYDDIAKYTSTLNGKTDSLISVVKQCFEKLDSLSYAMYGTHR